MRYLIVIILTFSTFSCVDKVFLTTTTITNNSGYDIGLQIYFNGGIIPFDSIGNNEKKEYKNGFSRGGPMNAIFPFAHGDSIMVVYLKEASIWHTRNKNSKVSKSLMLESSYEGGKVNEDLYEYTYTFTPADFEEALEFGD